MYSLKTYLLGVLAKKYRYAGRTPVTYACINQLDQYSKCYFLVIKDSVAADWTGQLNKANFSRSVIRVLWTLNLLTYTNSMRREKIGVS